MNGTESINDLSFIIDDKTLDESYIAENNIPVNDDISVLYKDSLLLSSGASIHEINTLRKHISDFKGGNLAKKYLIQVEPY